MHILEQTKQIVKEKYIKLLFKSGMSLTGQCL